ncbi:MAG: signal peptide peptidase SppA [Deltaproteobacteria bacterium]|nr:signal peptide peptidase SppA [Deltaproteobacteria bacterium]
MAVKYSPKLSQAEGGRPALTLTLALALVAILVLASAGCVSVYLRTPLEPLKEKTLSGEGRDKVLLLDISGPMLFGGGNSQAASPPLAGLFGQEMSLPARVAEELDKAAEDEHIKAVVLKIDSPGGAIAVCDLLYHQIMAYKAKTGVKVVASLMGVAASGGYYVALAGDRILALPTTLTGSVGVILVRLNLSGLLEKVGVSAQATKSGRLKDMWSLFRPASREEDQITQALVDNFFARFQGLVRERRPGVTPEQLAQVSTGRVFSAQEALALHLVDEIGYPEDALGQAKSLAGLEEARLVVYHRPREYRPNLYAGGEAAAPAPGLSQADLAALAVSPRFMYLWLPGL